MSLRVGRPALLSLLLAATAAAQEPTPLLEVPAARAPRPSLRDRLQGGVTRLARSVPGLRGLAPPTTGIRPRPRRVIEPRHTVLPVATSTISTSKDTTGASPEPTRCIW